MTFVMISEQKSPLEFLANFLGGAFVVGAIRFGHLGANQIRHPKLFFHPKRHRLEERSKASGRVIQISLEQPIKLQQWLVIEADVVELFGGEACFFQTIAS